MHATLSLAVALFFNIKQTILECWVLMLKHDRVLTHAGVRLERAVPLLEQLIYDNDLPRSKVGFGLRSDLHTPAMGSNYGPNPRETSIFGR